MSAMDDMYDHLGWRDEDREEVYDQDLMIISPRAQAQALVNEQLLMWEHELAQPDYYNYYLEEMTRCSTAQAGSL